MAAQPVDMMVHVPSFGFNQREAWGSGRGFIFSRTIPMLPRSFVLGNGPDTFVNVFPHYDRLGVIYSGLPGNTRVDKAHNIYLHTWIGNGGIATLAMIFLFGYYILTTFVSLVRTKGDTTLIHGLRLGLLAGISAFAVASLATDSTIGSTGVFFVLLGMGYGLNMWVEGNKKTASF
jgi:O-antigen ligase